MKDLLKTDFIKKTLLASSLLFLMSGAALADTIIPFMDSLPAYWPGYASSDASDNGKETIGQPQITHGEVVLSDSGYLKEVSFYFNTWNTDKMKPGDLFLNTDNDSAWDYVMSLYNGVNRNWNDQYTPTTNFNSVPLYEVNDNATLLLTGPDNTGYWSGFNIRNDHPYAYTDLTGPALGFGSISGGFNNNSPLTFVLPDDPNSLIFITDSLTIGFTENCANDPIYETVVPEPSTLVFLGSGLLLLAGFLKRKRS